MSQSRDLAIADTGEPLLATARADDQSETLFRRYQFDAVGALTAYFALLFFIPARWVLPGLGAAGRPASVFGIGLFALWCILQFLPDYESRRTPMRWVLLANSLALMISYASGFDRGLPGIESLAADRALLDLVSLNGVILMASEGLRTPAAVEKLGKRLLLISSAISVVALIQFFAGIDPYSHIRFPGLVLNFELSGLTSRGSGGLVRAKGSMLHPIEFAVVMAMMLPLAIHLALHEANRVLRHRRYAIVGVHAAGSMLAVSRSAVIALAAGLIVLVWAWSPRTRLAASAAGVIFLMALRSAIPGLLGTIKSLFTHWQQDTSVSGRTDDYELIRQYVNDRPWFGRGTGTFVPSEYFTLDNAYLGRVVTTGLVGLSMLLVLLVSGLLFARHCARTYPDNAVRHLGAALMGTILAASVAAGTFDLLDFPTASGVLLVALGASAAVAAAKQDLGHVAEEPPYAPPGLLRLGYRHGYKRSPWWHRFDPEIREQRRKQVREDRSL